MDPCAGAGGGTLDCSGQIPSQNPNPLVATLSARWPPLSGQRDGGHQPACGLPEQSSRAGLAARPALAEELIQQAQEIIDALVGGSKPHAKIQRHLAWDRWEDAPAV